MDGAESVGRKLRSFLGRLELTYVPVEQSEALGSGKLFGFGRMARCSDNIVSPLQKRANDTGPNALGSAGDNDSLVQIFDSTLLSSDFFFRLRMFSNWGPGRAPA